MELTKLRIRNYKGIRDTEIDLVGRSPYAPAAARVHTLVGINESGKTSLLEAMCFFAPDDEAWTIAHQEDLPNYVSWIPKHRYVAFDDAIRMTGAIAVGNGEWAALCAAFAEEHGHECDQSALPERFEYETRYEYHASTMTGVKHLVDFPLRFRACGSGDAWKEDADLAEKFVALLRHRALPAMVYYPGFLFEFPKRIYLTDPDRTPANRFYCNLFQDVLDQVRIEGADAQRLSIEENVAKQMRKKEAPYGEWDLWMGDSGTKEKVGAVARYAADKITRVVLGAWNEIYGQPVVEKRVLIHTDFAPGKSQNGAPATRHEAYAEFRIENGLTNYDVNDRSLGFRWFFAFLLFTRFRALRDGQRPLIFLLDEPAANLHPSAQKALLDSFPKIAAAPNRLVYSTHSHYMVKPQWLEQAFVAFDARNDPSEDVLVQAARPVHQVDIKAQPYRQFVQQHQDKASYFMPALEALRYEPSLLDPNLAGLIVEGKSDYYHILLAKLVTGIDAPSIFPAFGAGDAGTLVALHRGWGQPVRVLFDSDAAGERGLEKLRARFNLTDAHVVTIGGLVNGLKTIEGVYSDGDKAKLAPDKKPEKSKGQLWKRAQELVAAGQDAELPQFEEKTVANMRELLMAIKRFVGEGE